MKNNIGAETSTHDFWARPPWHGGAAKHALGLRPVELREWMVNDAALLANKQQVLEQRYDDAVAMVDDSLGLHETLASLPLPKANRYPHAIANAAGCIAEDLCVLDVDRDQILVAACVCAPSYWSLAEKIGRPLHDVHAPVHGMNAKIGGRIRHFIDRLPERTPFLRQNWFVHRDRNYFNAANEAYLSVPMSRWVVRSERQVLFKPNPQYVVFTILVTFAELADLGAHPRAAADLAKTLGRMDVDEIAQFGGWVKYRALLDYVGSQIAAHD
jgi:hypothetical protein